MSAVPVLSVSGASRVALPELLENGPAVWDALDAHTPFMSWAWHRAWAEAAPDAAASFALLSRRDDGNPDALLPLARRRTLFHRVPVTALTWAIGDMGCPDYLDVPAMPDADLSALVPQLESLDWQVIVLSNLAPDMPNARRLCAALVERGHTLHREPLWTCPYLELSDDWERYLAGVTKSRRQALRYMDRNLRRRHAVTITDYNGERVEEGWRHLVDLHQRRWTSPGALSDPAIQRLHLRFAKELSQRGELWLTTLDLDGVPGAAWYGFTHGDTVYFYQCGRDPQWEKESVGQVIIAAMIRRAMERGFKRFDFLRGNDPYKQHWTSSARITEQLTIFRRGWRGLGLRGLEVLADLRSRLRKSSDA